MNGEVEKVSHLVALPEAKKARKTAAARKIVFWKCADIVQKKNNNG